LTVSLCLCLLLGLPCLVWCGSCGVTCVCVCVFSFLLGLDWLSKLFTPAARPCLAASPPLAGEQDPFCPLRSNFSNIGPSIQVRSKTDSWGGSRYAPFHLVDPSLRVRPFSCARAKFWGFSYAFQACTRRLAAHAAYDTIHSSDSVQVPRLSRFESALAFGLGGRNTHRCHRRPRMHLRHGACYTLNI
jgi:hypothetical protein